MKIGSLDLGHRLVVAPMADVSDASFRMISRKYGAGLTYTPMVSAKGVVQNSFDTLKLLAFNHSEKPIGVQILGKDPQLVGDAIKEMRSMKPDVVDLNAGCPMEKVTKYKMGAEILDNQPLLGKIVRRMVDSAGDIPVSIKIRLGKNHSNINAVENAKIIEDNGASVIVLHARTKLQSYDEPADWNWIKEVKKSVKIPVIGNGSVFSPQDAVKMMEETNCDSVMVARGAIGNPFIFSRFNSIIEKGVDPGEPDVDDVLSAAINHVQLMKKDYGELVAVNKSKKSVIWYFRNFDGTSKMLEEVFAIKSLDSLINYISEHTQKIKSGKFPKEDVSLINKNFNDRVLFWLTRSEESIKPE